MALEPLHDDWQLHDSCGNHAGACRDARAQLAAQASAYATEVARLRAQVAELQGRLAATGAADHAAAEIVAADDSATEDNAEGPETTSFADAWHQDGEATFAERLAVREFFYLDPSDEPARRWFLEKG